MALDYRKAAQGVLDNIGGASNVASAAHCATRLRLVINDNSKVNKEAIENVDGVKGCFEAAGQLQVIFGTGTVNKVFEEFISISGVEAGTKESAKEAAAQKQNPFFRAIKTLGDVFVPIIPAIVASGLLTGVETAAEVLGLEAVDFPQETAIGALGLYISQGSIGEFQPMNINFGIIRSLDYRVKGKRNKNAEISRRSLAILDTLLEKEVFHLEDHC